MSSVQLLSHPQLCVTPWTAAHQASLSVTNSWSLLRLTAIESMMPSNYVILCRPVLSPLIFSSIRVFSNESVLCIRRPKYCSLSFSISPSNEYSGLISFRVDWVDLLAVQARIMTPNQYPLYQPTADGTHTQSMTINKPNWLNAKICIV